LKLQQQQPSTTKKAAACKKASQNENSIETAGVYEARPQL